MVFVGACRFNKCQVLAAAVVMAEHPAAAVCLFTGSARPLAATTTGLFCFAGVPLFAMVLGSIASFQIDQLMELRVQVRLSLLLVCRSLRGVGLGLRFVRRRFSCGFALGALSERPSLCPLACLLVSLRFRGTTTGRNALSGTSK